MTRRSINVPGLGHGGAPIPQASMVGPLLVSGGISGMDPRSGEIAESADSQVALVFENIGRIMIAAGGSLDDVVKVTFFARDRSLRRQIDTQWVRTFPDADSRPARHFMIADIPPIMAIQCEVIAFLQGEAQ